MKKMLALLVSLVLVLGTIPVFTLTASAKSYSGTCGANLTWSLDTETGVLNITGTGDMKDYSYNPYAPWDRYIDYVKTVNIADTVTSIGGYAFCSCYGLTSITIPESVTSIGSSAFSGTGLTKVNIPDLEAWCKIDFVDSYANPLYYAKHLYLNGEEITKLEIPNTITSIKPYAFYNCTKLTSVTIPNSVTSIGKSAFYYCKNLTSITIPESVTSIGEGAFEECIGLTSITIPESVTSIGSSAFSGCTGLKNITIPNSVTSIGNYAFEGCRNLKTVNNYSALNIIKRESDNGYAGYYADTVNWYYPSSGKCGENLEYHFNAATGELSITGSGAMTNYSSSNAPWYNYRSLIKSVAVGNEVTSIGNYAFYKCTGLIEITIPNSVTSIGNYAFYKCTGLIEITIPNSVTSIGDYAFSGCTGLIEITISNSVKSIGNYAFYGCTNLKTVNNYSALYIVKGKTNNGHVGYYADTVNWYYPSSGKCGENLEYHFNAATGELSITGSGAMTNYSSSNAPWYNYRSLIKSVAVGNEVTSIGNYAFYDCTGLSSITIPESVTSIGENAFYGCTGLTSVTIGNSVKSIGYYAFYGCTGLTSVTIGNSVKSIGYDAFYDCTGLSSITIPESVTSIDENAFYGCTGLTGVYITDLEAWCKIGFGYTTANPLYYAGHLYLNGEEITKLEIPNTITSIKSYAFYNCTGLTSVTIPNSVERIGSYAFYNCTKLTSVTIPNSVESIGSYAFYNCTGLTSVTIPNSVTSIGYKAFECCKNLKTVNNYSALYIAKGGTNNGYLGYYANTVNWYGIVTGSCGKNLEYHFNTATGELSITGSGAMTNYSSSNAPWYNYKSLIKSVAVGNKVTSIGSSAFKGCTKLTSVTIPNSVKSIGGYAFYGCTNLKTVNNYSALDIVKDKTNNGYVGYYADTVNCYGIVTGSCGKNLEYHFNAATGELSITGSGAMTNYNSSIAPWYNYNSLIKTVTIGNEVTSIGNYAFYNCTGFTSVTIGNSVKSIGDYAFCYCTRLTSVTIPNSVKSIGDYAFCYCTRLTSVTIPNSVKSIGDYAFFGCGLVVIKGCPDSAAAKYADSYSIKFKGAHKYATKIVKKATLNANGSTQKYCIVCKKVASTSAIKKVNSFKLSTTTYTYNGKVKTPTVTVKNSAGTKLIKNTDYTVKYSGGRKNVGKYKVIVTLKGKYSGKKTIYFAINPAKTTVKKLTPATKALKVSITKKSSQVTGYQIQYATNKSFKSVKTKTISSYKTTTVTLSKLSAKKTYYVRVRTYKTVNGKKYYSGWSSYKYKKTK